MQKAWIDSFANEKHRRMLFPKNPTGAGKQFLDFLIKKRLSPARLLDIGCGNGRNAAVLAQKGFEVYGFDGIPEAILEAKDSVRHEERFIVYDATQAPWPYQDAYFDYAIDSNTFSSIVSNPLLYVQELARVIKPGGYFFIYTYTLHDAYYQQFMQVEEAQAPVAITCLDDGVRRLLYDEPSIEAVFEQHFTLIQSNTTIRYSKMFDTYYKRNFVGMIFERQ